MATKGVELGTVGFNLEANDSDLAKSLVTLQQFGAEVNRASNSTTEAGQKIYRGMVQVERSITGVYDKVSALADNMAKAGASADAISKLTSQYDALANAMIKASRAPEPHEFVRASVGLGAATNQATRALKEQTDQTALLHARQNALVNAYEKAENITSRMTRRGASPEDLERVNAAYRNYHGLLTATELSTTGLKEANRAFKLELGEVTRELTASTHAANLAERQQARLIQATRNTAYVNARAARMNLPTSFTDANAGALTGLGNALQGGNPNEIVGAQQRLNNALMATRMAMIGAEAPTSRMSIALHDFSRASVLALGPLSGIGARISVMTALLDSNTVSVALAIGGAVAMGTALYALSRASIAATTAQQQFDAQLTSATGSPLLAAKEYQYLLDTANRLGIGIKGIVKPYADFAASARLSGMAASDQKRIFEAVTVTGTALRWSSEQQGRAFLALTQMIGKTTVMSEEYKKQLGELIPNIIGLGAEAENTSTKGLFKMMKNSELLALQHLPKLAEVLITTFGPAAAEGAKTITAQQERLANATFETLKAFDRATGISEIYRGALVALTSAMNYLGANMSTVVASMGALAGAGAGLAVAALLRGLPALAIAAGSAIASIATGTLTLSAALNALSASSIVGWVIRLTSMVLGAAMAFNFFKEKADEMLDKSQQINAKLQDWIDLQEKVGKTQKRTHQEMVQLASDRLGVIDTEILKQQDLIEARRKALEESRKIEAAGREMFGKNSPLRKMSKVEDDPEIQAAKKRTSTLVEEWSKLNAQKARLDSLTVANDPIQDNEEATKAWEHWAHRVSKAIADVVDKKEQLKAFDEGGVAAQKIAEAMGKAKALFAEMPKDKQRIGEMSAELQKAGYSGATLVDQLQQMYIAEDNAATKLRDIGKELKDYKVSSQAVLDLWEKLGVRRVAISGEVSGLGPEQAKAAKELQQDLNELQRLYKDLGVSEEVMTTALQNYSDEWKKVHGAEQHQKEIERVTTALERLGLKLGDTPARLAAAEAKSIALIQEAVKLEIITQVEGDKLILQAKEDTYRKLTGTADDYYKKLHQMFGKLEDGLVSAFVNGGKGGKDAFATMLDEMVKEVLGFVARIAIVKPLMTNLFGSLYSGNKASGSGMFGNLLGSVGAFLSGNPFAAIGSLVAGSSAPVAGARAVGGGVNPFESYLVGESGPEILQMGGQSGNIIPNKDIGKGGGALAYSDNSRNVFHIDARSDVAAIMAIVQASQRSNNSAIFRQLKATYGS